MINDGLKSMIVNSMGSDTLPKNVKLTRRQRIERSEQYRKKQSQYMRERFNLTHGGTKQNKKRRKRRS